HPRDAKTTVDQTDALAFLPVDDSTVPRDVDNGEIAAAWAGRGRWATPVRWYAEVAGRTDGRRGDRAREVLRRQGDIGACGQRRIRHVAVVGKRAVGQRRVLEHRRVPENGGVPAGRYRPAAPDAAREAHRVPGGHVDQVDLVVELHHRAAIAARSALGRFPTVLRRVLGGRKGRVRIQPGVLLLVLDAADADAVPGADDV